MVENCWVIPHGRGIGGGYAGGADGGCNKALRGSGAAESADCFKIHKPE